MRGTGIDSDVEIKSETPVIKEADSKGDASDLWSGGTQFESGPGYRLSRLSLYVVFPVLPGKLREGTLN
jgi:hypothetical protein